MKPLFLRVMCKLSTIRVLLSSCSYAIYMIFVPAVNITGLV